MPRFALDIEFDGRDFLGTQWQEGHRTLQGVVEEAAARVGDAYRQSRDRFHASSRLDAGVGARSFIAHYTTHKQWDPETFGRALNGNLPPDAVVRRVAAVDDEWHARYQKSVKTYTYLVVNRGVRPVLQRDSWWIRRPLNVEILHKCAHDLLGQHDLSGFAALRGDESDEGDPVRRVTSSSWSAQDAAEGRELTFTVSGEGFLYKQVRGLVGAMVEVARGGVEYTDFLATKAGGRSAPRCGSIAPADGLMLDKVSLEKEPQWVVVR